MYKTKFDILFNKTVPKNVYFAKERKLITPYPIYFG